MNSFIIMAFVVAAGGISVLIRRMQQRNNRLRQEVDDLKDRLRKHQSGLFQRADKHGQGGQWDPATENRLRHYLHLMDRLINTIPNPIYFIDEGGVFRGCNRAFARDVLGVSRDQIIGRPITGLTDRISPRLTEAHHKRMMHGKDLTGTQSLETQILCADGQTREFLVTAAPVSSDEDPAMGSIGVLLDLTDKNRAILDRIQAEKLQGVLETAGAVCHELNQPLQTLSGYVELAQLPGTQDANPGGMYSKMEVQIDRMVRITRSLQNLTQYKTIPYTDHTLIVDIHTAARDKSPEHNHEKQNRAPLFGKEPGRIDSIGSRRRSTGGAD